MERLAWRVTLFSLFLASGVFCLSGNARLEGKAKRFQLPFSAPNQVTQSQWAGPLPQDALSQRPSVPFYGNQIPRSSEASMFGQQMPFTSPPTVPIATNEMFDDPTNRGQLSSTSLSFLQGQFQTRNSRPSGEKVEYFEPNDSQETSPYLDSKQFADNGPTREDLKTIQPLLDSENDITNAIIKDTWSQDTALTSPRQAVSEGLTTSHQLANLEWKNKAVVQDNSSKQSNPNNFAVDQVRPEGLIKQESSSHHDRQEQIAMVGEAIHQTSSAKIDNKIPTDNSSAEIMSHHYLQEDMSMVGEQNHTTKSATTDNRIPTDNSSATIKDSTELRNHSAVTSSVVENDSMNNNLSYSHSHNEWFTNTSLAMGNSSLSDSQKNESTVKPYTAADYLQTLYPQLSVFKAPFEIDEKNPSSAKTFLKSSPVALHSSPLLPNHGTLGKNSSSPLLKLVLKNDRTSKLSPEMQRKVQKALLMSLLRSSSNLGQRSVVKPQSLSAPRYISSASNLLLTRSEKTGKQAPGFRYLTEAGAKLLPAHIFSPLGSVFKDPLGPTKAPLKTSPSTPVPTTPGTQHKAKPNPVLNQHRLD